MATTGHESEIIQVQGLKAALKDGGNKGLFNEATCSTAAATAAKTVTAPTSFSLVSGATIIVKFTNAISVASATLKVGDTDAKPIYYRGAALAKNLVAAGDRLILRYNGTQYDILGHIDTNTDTKVTSVANHYAPTADSDSGLSASASGATASWGIDVVKGVQVQRDAKGHVTGITVTSGKIPSDPSVANTVTGSGLTADKIVLGNGNSAVKTSSKGITTTNPSANSTDDNLPTSKAVWGAIADGIAANDAMVYKGTIAGGSTGSYGALTAAANRGWTYKVSTAGKIDGIAVEVGDMIICNTDSTAAATSSNYSTIAAKWDYIQANVDGVLFKSSNTFTNGHVLVADSTAGKVKDSGYTIGKSVPSNAVFTDTTYSVMGASGSSHASGLVPDPGATQGTTKFLREDGSWQVPAYPTIEDFHEAVATLSATPTSSTLTYTRDGVTYNYKIGDEVRVADQEAEEGYKFYKLYDITGTAPNQEAVWGGLGGVSQKTYVVTIDSNQTDKTDIASAEITYNGTAYSHGDTIIVPVFTDITSSDLSATSITGYYANIQVNGAVINITYQTEVVSVTVTTDFSGASTQGQIITINGSNYTVGSTGIVTAKVPYNTQYSISADARTGFTTPSSVSYTAEQASRSVTMTYTMVTLGVFAYYSDKTFRTETDADSNAIGVAVITSNVRLVIDKTDALSGTTRYGGYNKDLSTTAVTTDIQATALADFRGEQNTTNIINACAGYYDGYVTGAVAAVACRAKFGGLGYMGALGEWQEAYNNKAAVGSMMTKIGGTAITTSSYYWTSTHYNASTNTWQLGWGNGTVDYANRYTDYYYVRAFLAL